MTPNLDHGQLPGLDGLALHYSSSSFLPIHSPVTEQKMKAMQAMSDNVAKDLGKDIALDHLIDHIFLPDNLPQDGDVNTPEKEIALLIFVKNALECFSSTQIRQTTSARIPHVVKMMQKMANAHEGNFLQEVILRKVFKEMRTGDIVPLFIHAQNAGLIIRHTCCEVTFESFEVSPHNEAVIQCQGRLRCSYPGPIIAIPATTFKDATFQEQLTRLLEDMSKKLPTDRPCRRTAKAGTEVTEIRNTVKPIYITEFLTGLLRGIGRPVLNRRRICKRIADEVLWRNARIPWRRSPFWLVIRVALETSLSDEAPGVQANMRFREYKIVMLYIMAKVLNAATWMQATPSEKLSHMCRKLGRRAAKLGEDIPSPLFEFVKETIHDAGAILAIRFRNAQLSSVREMEWPPTAGLDPEADTNITMPHSRKYINNILDEFNLHALSTKKATFCCKHPKRLCYQGCTAAKIPDQSTLSASGADLRIALHDIEAWVESSLDNFVSINIAQETTCRELYNFLIAYVKAAKPEYEGNPLDTSLMFLTTMELWVAIDRIATTVCPLLKEYNCEMAPDEMEPDILSMLLLTTRSQLARLRKIESYIHARQNAVTQDNSVFEDGTQISPTSFTVRYFRQSPEYQLLLADITDKATKSREEKKAEFIRMKEEYDDTMERSKGMRCECISLRHRKEKIQCTKCTLQSEAENLTITVHEWPLPSCQLEAQATTVELRLPVAFGAWRDATYEVLVNIFNPSLQKETCYSYQLLEGYNGLSHYFTNQSQKISWASATKSFPQAHFGTRHVGKVLSSSDYLVPNGLRYKLASGRLGASLWIRDVLTASAVKRRDDVRKICTFKLPDASAKLQYALDSTEHTSNFSLANQNACPKEWSLHEYDAFTTLRAGFRLQWLNILREIRAGNLYLNRVETNLLFMQTIWQAGPAGTPAIPIRESHGNLQEQGFCNHMVDALEASLSIIKQNWLEKISMQTLIAIGARVLSLAPEEIKDRAAEFLRMCRKVCMDWMHDMVNRIDSAESDTSLQKWQQHALAIAAISRLTFNVDLADLKYVMKSKDDVVDFIECANRVHDNFPPEVSQHPLRFLLERNARLAHSVESHLRELIVKNKGWLDEAILRLWPQYKTPGVPWRVLETPDERWITTEICGEKNKPPMSVHYNLLEGTFLVDGLPFARLPKEYVNHPDYYRLFQNRIFSVKRPAAMPGMSFELIRPLSLANTELQLYFTMRENDLIIRTQNGSTVHEIIPRCKLEGDFPQTMLKDFVHFLDLKEKTLEFRPLKNSESLWLPSSGNWIVSISGAQREWQAQGTRDLRTGKVRLIDYPSPTSQLIGKLLRSLESEGNIEVTLNSKNMVNVRLPRYQLEFAFDGSHIGESSIKCHNFPGMVIDVRAAVGQEIGTLYGLKNYLVLRESTSTLNSMLRTVIIPHGKIQSEIKEGHTSVSIATDTFETVNYHLYTIDPLLGRLVPNGSMRSHLYKIYLHAVTAYCLPDPLTGLTGTEQALDDLRSASSWSFQKLGADELELLGWISKLSPKRTFYPSHLRLMQTIEWKTSLPSYCQRWEFHSLVKSILNHWERTKMFHQTKADVEVDIQEVAEHLQTKASIRGAACQPVEYWGNVDSRSSDEYYTGDKIDEMMESRVCRVSSLVQNWAADVRPTKGLARYLLHWGTLGSKANQDVEYQHYWHDSDMEDDWYSLYEFFRTSSREDDQYKILFVLATLSYRGDAEVSMELIETILAFATNETFAGIDPPKIARKKKSYHLTYGSKPTADNIREIVLRQKNVVPFESSPEYRWPRTELSEDSHAYRFRRKRAYETRLEQQIDEAVSYYQSQWPCRTLSEPPKGHWDLLRSDLALPILTEKWSHWYHNYLYLQHIALVQEELDEITPDDELKIVQKYRFNPFYNLAPAADTQKSLQLLLNTKEPPTPNYEDFTGHHQTRQLKVQDYLQQLITRLSNGPSEFQKHYSKDLTTSWNALLEQEPSTTKASHVVIPPLNSVGSYVNLCGEDVRGLLQEIVSALCPEKGTIEELLFMTGLRPRITRRSLLSQLTSTTESGHLQRTDRQKEWNDLLLLLGESISKYQQAIRLFHHARCKDPVEFHKEWTNGGRAGWNPREYPEWLLFEIENNLLIRPVQAQIASKMLFPTDGGNSVMQLNMGEGKSSVIVPIVAAALADKKTLVRVIALKSLSSQMFHLLVQKLSGLLNRRIYYLPFHRQIKLKESTLKLIQGLYQECLDTGGIWLSQPEHLLSFKLMGIEKIHSDPRIADALLKSQHWLEEHSRDILDESDEVLHVRYQLIYTIGDQKDLQLSAERWTMIQELFGLVSKHMQEIKSRYPDGVELIEQKDAPGSFPFARLLKEEPEIELLEKIAKEVILKGVLGPVSTRWCTAEMSGQLFDFISKKEVGESSKVELQGVETMLPYLLLLRGMIAHRILAFVLREKRWRVDYGLAPHRSLLAVPYSAKDCPAPRAEFGHPDVTIALTCLSYYYQGLDHNQLRVCFERLKKVDNPASEYLTWIRGCEERLTPALQQLQGINIEDNHQWDHAIYPLLKLNKSVIDFYLTNIVFPKECKEFPHKLTTSGWDLAEKKKHPTTGFSGTNDNRYLLPLSIKQQDLPDQAHTNAKVLRYLLQPENNFYTCAQTEQHDRLPVKELLQKLLDETKPIQVLLDAGAQVLEMKNHEVAECWLQLARNGNYRWTAVVFFDDDDELTVMGKDGSEQPYMISPYVKNMETCLVYLDEAHTRGTDLKLPGDCIAAVTLGPKLTKDKLVQACMRMRNLGQGQSVRFFAPPEVHSKLLQHSGKNNFGANIETIDIISWVMYETCTQTQHNTALWANQGIGHQIRENVWAKHRAGELNNEQLALAWKEPESKSLEELYGPSRAQWDSITHVITEKLKDSELQARHKQLQSISSRCEECQVTSLHGVAVQEEQEREVANEVERLRHVEPPQAATPLIHKVDPAILEFIKTGIVSPKPDTSGSPFISLMKTLSQTSFRNKIESGPWAPNIIASTDFASTVKLDSGRSDSYLRPVNWIVSNVRAHHASPILCLLSPFEVNELLPHIRCSEAVNLHIYAPRAQRVAPTFEDLTYAAIPALPHRWVEGFPSRGQLMIQLNLFAGQLFFDSYTAYARTCGFLGIFLRREQKHLPCEVQTDGFRQGYRKDESTGTSVINSEIAFQKSPVAFVRSLAEVRRKGMKFGATHLGLLVHRKELERSEWE
ncbi:hypothetical protein BDZ91DRAFT_675137 [Kalaharituber pfeilii]|nr:hypothetical protein BDZ91DRAFT_675137 [Kalaharituber pfeilii]